MFSFLFWGLLLNSYYFNLCAFFVCLSVMLKKTKPYCLSSKRHQFSWELFLFQVVSNLVRCCDVSCVTQSSQEGGEPLPNPYLESSLQQHNQELQLFFFFQDFGNFHISALSSYGTFSSLPLLTPHVGVTYA